MQVTINFPPRSEPPPPPPPPPPVIQPPHQLWRVMHDAEIYAKGITWVSHGQVNAASADINWRMGYPEVFWLYQDDNQPVPFPERWQWLSFQLNPQMQPMKWQELHNDWIAFHNKGAGFPHPNIPGTPGYDNTYIPTPRRDYINKQWTTAPDPVWDKVRVCGGATISGALDGNYVIVDTLDVDNPPSSVDYIKARPWLYFTAVSKVRDANRQIVIVDFPQNGSYPSLVPLIARGRVRLPVVMLEKVSQIVDPYKIYV